MSIPQLFSKRFFIRRSQLSTYKMFVEFHEPEYRALLNSLSQGVYSAKPLKELSQRIFSGPFGSDRKVDMYQESGIPYLRVKDVLPEGIVRDGLMYISDEKHKDLARSCVVPGMVLITIAGRLGTAAVFPDDLNEGNITGHIVGIELNPEVNPHYVAYAINSRFGEFQVQRLGHRTTRPELNNKEVGRILIPLPPRQVQDRIAQIMQDAYVQCQRMLAEADNLLIDIDKEIVGRIGIPLAALSVKQRFFVNSRSLTGGRFDVGPYTNEFNVADFKSCEWARLSELADQIRKVKTASKTPDQKFSYVGMTDVDAEMAELTTHQLSGHEIESSKASARSGDIVFARIEPCIYNRKIAVVPNNVENILASTELLVARPRRSMDSNYLCWILRSEIVQRQIAGKMTGSTGRRRLSNKDFINLWIPKLSLNLQIELGEFASQQRDYVKQLRAEANRIVAEAKAQVERMILGEEADA